MVNPFPASVDDCVSLLSAADLGPVVVSLDNIASLLSVVTDSSSAITSVDTIICLSAVVFISPCSVIFSE